jgi:hypothetical protein
LSGQIGVGFSIGSGFDSALAQMKSKNVYLFKNWDINSVDMMNQMEITYATVRTLGKIHFET